MKKIIGKTNDKKSMIKTYRNIDDNKSMTKIIEKTNDKMKKQRQRKGMAKFREITIKNFKFYHLLFQILFEYHSRKKKRFMRLSDGYAHCKQVYKNAIIGPNEMTKKTRSIINHNKISLLLRRN